MILLRRRAIHDREVGSTWCIICLSGVPLELYQLNTIYRRNYGQESEPTAALDIDLAKLGSSMGRHGNGGPKILHSATALVLALALTFLIVCVGVVLLKTVERDCSNRIDIKGPAGLGTLTVESNYNCEDQSGSISLPKR